MKERKHIIISILFVIAVLFIIGAVLIINRIEPIPGDSTVPSSTSSTVSTESNIIISEEQVDFYTIKTMDNGNIGVFYGDKKEPCLVLHEILLMALPKFDREMLNSGITVYSDEELYTLIEDLDS